ncbi:hypothetical protein Afil01_62920 [Actinorhabdospora filicis]|uniref:Amino acid adenylation domain-containing protein n=1 Tax=Actinorhabdospora filicis TaxID=1785913 RepID=A0A9W6WE36_9ACTN|nr:amino acid adenylation domain-containing protein [Actinorhabdospora filicis]GLZ81485.1 hypothetical protein Afil01_62920 [Actinorhabdospora filicis]
MTPTTVGAPDLLAAVRTHTGTAILHNGAPIGYRELTARASAVAAALGPHPGAVGVYTSRTPETVIALLGVLTAGGAYVPVDPAYPEERQEAMLAAAGTGTVLVTAPGQAPPPGAVVVDVRGLGETDTETEPSPVDGTDAAYILFTSGSTGAPKPVVTPRRAISTVTAALRDLFGVTPADRVLQFASLSWDTCFEEILPALTSGATLVVDDEAHTGSFPRFLRMTAERGVTVLDLPTAYWHELVRHLAEDGGTLPESLRLLIIGGEAAAPARLAEWHGLGAGGVRLLNTYGCTETTLITHAVELGETVEGRVPIGRALPHVLERVTPEGELLIGGPALSLGYLGLPEATAARFGGDGFFRTGDRVERLPDGRLLHLGRLDGEVKIRGVRVDPAEVESLIGAHPDVAAVAVTGMAAAGRTVLTAYVVPAAHADPGALRASVLARLRATAPAHLLPGRLRVVPELAHTASGKVDRAGTRRRYEQGGEA